MYKTVDKLLQATDQNVSFSVHLESARSVVIHMNFSGVTKNIALVAIKLGMQTFATQIELGTFFF